MMNIHAATRLALLAALAATAAAQAQPVQPGDRHAVGFAPHPILLMDGRSASEAAEVLYLGDLLKPLPIFLPDPAPASLPMTVKPARAATGLPMLYSLLSSEDEPEMEQPRRGAEERDSWRHHHRDRRHIDLDDGGEHGGEHGGEGHSGGGPAPVPLPPALPLLGSVLAALLLVGASTRRS